MYAERTLVVALSACVLKLIFRAGRYLRRLLFHDSTHAIRKILLSTFLTVRVRYPRYLSPDTHGWAPPNYTSLETGSWKQMPRAWYRLIEFNCMWGGGWKLTFVLFAADSLENHAWH